MLQLSQKMNQQQRISMPLL